MAKTTEDSSEPLAELRELVEHLDSNGDGPAKKRTDRRHLLKMAGAAVLGAAGVAATRIVPASAVTGGNMIIGSANTASSATSLSTSAGDPGWSVVSGATAIQGTATSGTNEVGVAGVSKTGNGKGVGGQATSGIGVGGQVTSGQGVRGQASTGWGVYAEATGTGTGIISFSDGGGYDAQLGFPFVGGAAGSGRLGMVGRFDVGGVAPSWNPLFYVTSTGSYSFEHELVRGLDGSIWASRYDASSTPAAKRWKRINAVRVDASDGTGGIFKPFRRVDTRLLGAAKAAGAAYPFTVAGTGTGASSIPFDAVAVMGNLAAVNYTGPGFLTIMPAGIAIGTGVGQYNPNADPSSVNFIVGQAAIANSFVCGLNSAGALQVFVGVHSSQFVIDITAYLQ